MPWRRISIHITEAEKDLLEAVAIFEPWLPDAIDHRRRKGHQYLIKLDQEEFRDCISALTYGAQCNTPLNKKAELLMLADKIIVLGYAEGFDMDMKENFYE